MINSRLFQKGFAPVGILAMVGLVAVLGLTVWRANDIRSVLNLPKAADKITNGVHGESGSTSRQSAASLLAGQKLEGTGIVPKDGIWLSGSFSSDGTSGADGFEVGNNGTTIKNLWSKFYDNCKILNKISYPSEIVVQNGAFSISWNGYKVSAAFKSSTEADFTVQIQNYNFPDPKCSPRSTGLLTGKATWQSGLAPQAGYKSATYSCYDGTTGTVGDGQTCQSDVELNKQATAKCVGHDKCEPGTGGNSSISILNLSNSCGLGMFGYVSYTCTGGKTGVLGGDSSCKSPLDWTNVVLVTCGNAEVCKSGLNSFTLGAACTGRGGTITNSGPIPNCGNLSGPTTIALGQSGTFSAEYSSVQGNLGGEILAGQNGKSIWAPCNSGASADRQKCTALSGTSGSKTFTWTPTAAGTYDVYCRAWNDGIAECRGNAAYVDGVPRYACSGPKSSMTVTVGTTPACTGAPCKGNSKDAKRSCHDFDSGASAADSRCRRTAGCVEDFGKCSGDYYIAQCSAHGNPTDCQNDGGCYWDKACAK